LTEQQKPNPELDAIVRAEVARQLLERRPSDAHSPAGFGSTHAGLGLGIGTGGDALGPLASGVWAMLAAGSPRLALAKALGVPLAPYFINVRATFENTDVTDVPSEGADVKVVQDTLVDAMVFRIVNQSQTANLNQFQAQSDYYYNFQSGLDVTLDVQGAPRYSVAPKFTPLSTVADMINGNSHWPGGWILTYQEQIFMAFHATVTLPFAPIEVIVTFRGWVPTSEAFVSMRNRDAIDQLSTDCGIQVTDAYRQRAIARG
jgi:hypothetical protein